MIRLRLLILFLLCSCCLASYSQPLTDSQLLTEAARICASESHEPEECTLLIKAGERWQLEEMKAFVEMREGRECDVRYERLKAITTALLDIAVKQFGALSVESMKCRRAKILAYYSTDYAATKALAERNVSDARTLCHAHPSDLKLKEFYLLTQLEDLQLRSDRELDNPLLWKETYLIEQQCDTLYQQLTADSEERKEIYTYLGTLKNLNTSYCDYLNYLFWTLYPKGSPVETKLYGNGVMTSSGAYLRMAYEMSSRLYGEAHVTTSAARLAYLQFMISQGQIDANTGYNELSQMLMRLRAYSPPSFELAMRTEMLMWNCDLKSKSHLYELDRYNALLFDAASTFGRDSEMYLSYLINMMTLLQNVNVSAATALGEQVDELSEHVYAELPDLRWMSRLEQYTLKQGTLETSAFNDYIQGLIEYYTTAHHPSWTSICFGRTFADLLRTYLFRYEDAAEVFSLVLTDVEQLVGKCHDVFAVDLNMAIGYLADAKRYEKAEQLAKQGLDAHLLAGQLDPSLCSQLFDISLQKNETEAAKRYAEQGIKTSHELEATGWECYLQLQLANILLEDDEVQQAAPLFEQAIPVYLAMDDNVTGFAKGYFLIANYYSRIAQYDKAAEVLEEGFMRYVNFFDVYDATAVRFISTLYSLYADQLNDFDRAETILEGHLRQMTLSPTTNNHDEILQLLWMHYNMMMKKQPNNLTKRSALLQDIQRETMLICQRLNSTSYFDLSTWLMPLFNEVIMMAGQYFGEADQNLRDMEEQIKQAQTEDYKQEMTRNVEIARKQMEQYKAQLSDDMLPILKDFEEEIRTQRPDYLESWEYFDVTRDLSIIYLSILRDSIAGDYWIRAQEKSENKGIRSRVLLNLGQYESAKRHYAQAATYFETFNALIEKYYPNILSPNSQVGFKYDLFTAYYNTGRKDKAIELARDIHRLRTQLIRNNLDVMTEAEREAFVGSDTGGQSLQMLLPDFPELLAGECYNSMLEEKGLLLRAASTKRQAIMHSGDSALIAHLAALDALNAQYRQKNTMTNWQEGEFFLDKDITDLHGQIEQLERQVNRDAAQYYQESPVIIWQQVQKKLSAGDAAIEFVNSDDTTGALVLLPDGLAPHYVALTNSDVLYEELEAMKTLRSRQRVEKLYQEDILHLYQRLWQPLTTILGDTHRIFYSPTGYLNSLAFAAIRHPEGNYLTDHYELHQLTTTAELAQPRHARPQTVKALLLGAVYYSPEQKVVAQEIASNAISRGAEDDRGAILDDDEPFSYLSFTADEVKQLKAMMDSMHIATETRMGLQADEKTLAGASGNSPFIMHLSTHGYFLATEEDVLRNKFLARYPATRFSSMQRAGLALAGANATWLAANNEPESADGILTATEVSRLDLRQTGLAVLSACQTGVGLYSREGVYGMHRGFKQAGVGSILATLWNVNDRSTAQLMMFFYRRWLAGMPMQRALREAVVELRKEYPSPFYWAPFVLMDATE